MSLFFFLLRSDKVERGRSPAKALVSYSGGSRTATATSVPFLIGENFTTWAIKVEADLDAIGLWETVVPPEDAALAVIAKKDKLERAYQVCTCEW
ncbi:hypothetical protein D1007_24431 [Hordeum vulgare]|nr:hypothetical protein D1007_24431 [Hordeum vulgare]